MKVQNFSMTRSMLHIDRLHLTDFRSYASMTLQPGGRSVVLTGPNGAGKTNILEALSFLSPGRGLRAGRLADVSRMNRENPLPTAPLWAVAARLGTPAGERELGTGLMPAPDPQARERRLARIDGENLSSPAAFGDIIQMTWLTPQMDRLFIEAPAGRRRFLDRIVANFYPAHNRALNAYERAMRERNRLLGLGHGDQRWLDSLEGRMAEHGVAVAAARLDALARLQKAMAAASACFPRALMAIDGLLEQGMTDGTALAVEEDFRQQLRNHRDQDSRRGRTSIGPHKSDFLVTHQARNMPAALCSTGEQKALLIAITLASVRITTAAFGAAPVLLLDEVVAHLDRERRASLFDELSALGAQVWLTGTDRLLFEDLKSRARYYRVEDSIVTEE